MPESNTFVFEMSIEKLNSHKLPGVIQIPREIIKAGGRKIRSDIHKSINSIRSKEELSEE